MAPLTPVLGDSPRVRILEALVRLGDIEFTRGELAREAEVYRMTTNRMVPQLVAEGLIERVGKGPQPKFRVRDASPTMRVIGYLEAALGLLEEPDPLEGAEIEKAVEEFRKSIVANQGLVDELISSERERTGALSRAKANPVRRS